MMKRLVAAALFASLATPAMAAMNIHQNSDGTADWIGAKSDTTSNCVGGANLPFTVQLNSNASAWQIVPISNAVIKDAAAVTYGTTTGTAKLTIWANTTSSPVMFSNSSNSLTTQAYIPFAGTSAGTTKRLSTIAQTTGASKLINNTVKQYDYIAVASNGGATGLVSAAVLVKVCPR